MIKVGRKDEHIFTDALYKEASFAKRAEFIKYKVDSLNLPEIKCAAVISPIIVQADLARESIYKYVDLTAVKPHSNIKDIRALCAAAAEKKCFGVCVNQTFVRDAKELLSGSGVKIISTVDFPFGCSAAEAKVFGAIKALENGADELDAVMNIGLFKSGRYAKVYDEIRKITEAAENKPVKVIIEACFLKDEEKVLACLLAKKAGAAFIKTSTGFGTGGASAEDIKLIRETVGSKTGVKASGGIRDFQTAKMMIEAGANRIGASTVFSTGF